jgi:hypothetical protein
MISRPFLVEVTTTTKECLLNGKGGSFRWISETVAAHPLRRKKARAGSSPAIGTI